jgi:hypothetical protein
MDEHLESIRLSINWVGTLESLRVFVTDPQIKGRGLLSRFLYAEIDFAIQKAEIIARKISERVSENWNDLLSGFLSKYWRTQSDEIVLMSTDAIQSIVDFTNEYVEAGSIKGVIFITEAMGRERSSYRIDYPSM